MEHPLNSFWGVHLWIEKSDRCGIPVYVIIWSVRDMNECPCMLNYKVLFQIARVTVYVVNTNLTKTPEELEKTALHLKMEFEMKDLGKTRLCLDLKLKHFSDGILVYQSNYTPKVSP